MKLAVTLIIVLALFSVYGIAQEYRQWDLPEGAKFRVGKGGVKWIAYSPDGARIAVPTRLGIWLYDAKTYKETALFAGHRGSVERVAFSPDGKLLASGGGALGKTVQLSNARTGEHLLTLNGHSDEVSSVAFSPDGKRLASGSLDETVRVWDTETGAHIRTLSGRAGLAGNAGPVYCVAFSPDGAFIASGGGLWDRLRMWDVNTGATLWAHMGHTHTVWIVAFSLDGRSLVSGSADGTVRLWDAATGKFLRYLADYGERASSVAYNANSRMIAIGGRYDNPLKLWDGKMEQPARIIRQKRTAYALTFSPDGGEFAFSSRDDSVRLFDTETGEQKGEIAGHLRMISGVAFSPNGRFIASRADWKIRLWDAYTGERSRTLFEGRAYGSNVVFSPDGGTIVCGNFREIHLWNVNTGKLVRTLTGLPGRIHTVAYSPDGKLIAGVDDSKKPAVGLWDVRTGEMSHLISWHNEKIPSLAFSMDGHTLAVASKDGSVTLWDTRTGALQRTLSGFDSEPRSVAFSRDGRTFASATNTRLILWNAFTWKKVRKFTGSGRAEAGIDFHPTGKWIVVGDGRVIEIWNTITGKLKHRITDNRLTVRNVAFSPDGTTFAADSFEALFVWPLDYPPNGANATVRITPSPIPSPQVGSQLTFSLAIAAGEDVAAYRATVSFDPSALRFVEGAAGDYLPGDTSFVSPVVDENRVTVEATTLGGGGDGDGTLVMFTFEVLAARPSSLTLSDVSLVSSEGERVEPEVVHGEVIEPPRIASDVNRDGAVNISDLLEVAANYEQLGGNDADINGDNLVDIRDIVQVAAAIGGEDAVSLVHPPDTSAISAADVADWLAQAQGLGVSVADLERGIRFLEQLLAALTPDDTLLLQNYPNPFNPETWIPYRLARGTEVEIAIYDAKGLLVRQLAHEYQPAGYYVVRGNAAYWDGRNEGGELVANGVYFYRLRAGDYSAARRMVIVK